MRSAGTFDSSGTSARSLRPEGQRRQGTASREQVRCADKRGRKGEREGRGEERREET